MKSGLRGLFAVAVLVCMAHSLAFAQGASSTTTLSGVVTDKDGGVVPGATVSVKNDATAAVAANVVTNSVGRYSVPSLEPGVYTVTITLTGFKTFVHSGVRVLAAQSVDLKAVLEVGALTETLTVTANSELVRTNTATVSSTVTSEFITSLPRTDRNALNFLIFLPGVETSGNGARDSTISGLPQNTINITIDGINTSNNLQSGDGFFSMVVPRLDAIEEVTMTSAVSGVDSSGQGATQVRFVTRSGTNQYQTSIYEYFRHNSLNTNTFFNRLAGLPKPRVTVHNYGGRIGGPIVIPGLVDGRGKAFFFFNHEETFQPNQVRRTRTVINEAAQQGLFTYNTNNPTSVNVLTLAAANGQLASQDPTIQPLLASIRAAVGTTGTLTTTSTALNTQSYNWLVDVRSYRHSPTGRVDFNLTDRHRLSGSTYWQRFNDTPDTLNNADPIFPNFPAQAWQASYRTTGSASLRSTFSSNLVNEVRSGWQWSPVDFFGNATRDMFANQGGYAVGLGFGISNAHPGNANGPQWRNTVNWNVDNNLNWLRGSHNLSMGFSFTRLTNIIDNSTTTQAVTLGFDTTNDPAAGLFTTTNFPGASNNDLGSARALYALLTGRVISLPGTGRLNVEGTEYVYNGHIIREERMDEYGLFLQDSWRIRPNLTMNFGLRYEVQMPFVPTSGTYTMSTLTDLCGPSGLGSGPGGRACNMFNPGVLNNPTVQPTYVRYDPGNPGYNTDFNNFGPSVGISWRPNVQDGFLRKLLGEPELATFSGGYTRTFNRERFDTFTGTFGNNPGATTPATRGTGATNFPLVYPGESWPILLRETNRLGPPDHIKTPTYPIVASFANGNDIAIFDPNIEIPYTDSWSVGFQRSLSRDTAVEIRYIGNRNNKAWTNENWNVENIYENGFLEEFKLAQANLRANIAAGRGNTFAYTGAPGTSPLPIYLAHFSAQPFAQAGDPSLYTSTQFTNSTFVNDLDYLDPDPDGAAATLWTGNSGVWRTNGRTAGLAQNFWVMNPLVDDANVRSAFAGSRYHSMQVDLRRRLSRGLVVQGSYTWARRWGSSLEELHFDRFYLRSENVPHAFKMLWNYQIPVGRGRRYGTDMNPWLDAVLGNWEWSGTGRIQVETYRLENTILVGMTFKEAEREFKKARVEIDPITGATTVWNMPEDIRQNTERAYNTSATSLTHYPAGEEPTGRYFAPAGSLNCMALYAGDCAPDMYFTGPWFSEFDFKFVKRFPIGRKVSIDFSAEVFNAFTNKNFTPSLDPSDGADGFQIGSTQSGARIGQLVWRINF